MRVTSRAGGGCGAGGGQRNSECKLAEAGMTECGPGPVPGDEPCDPSLKRVLGI